MSRYNSSGTQGSNGSNNFNDITLKIQEYAAIRIKPTRVNAFDSKYGDKFIAGFDDAAVIDGIVFQRDDKPGTWKVFSAGKFGNLNPDDGLVYEEYDAEADEYKGRIAADDILNMPKVLGFFEEFGGDEYNYTPVGVVIEQANDIALNDDVVGSDETGYLTDAEAEQAREKCEIPMGEVSMLLSNKSWVRTLAKKLTTRGDDIINDNGKGGEERDQNPKYDDRDWLTTKDPELRSELKNRPLELWNTEEPVPGQEDDDNPDTYTTPNLLDLKTSDEDNRNFVTIDNGIGDGNSDDTTQQTNHEQGSQQAEAAAADDSPAADPEPADVDATDEQVNDTNADAETAADGGLPSTLTSKDDLPDAIPDVLWDLIGYFARHNGEADPDQFRDFAEDEVDDPESVDWEMAAKAVPKHLDA